MCIYVCVCQRRLLSTLIAIISSPAICSILSGTYTQYLGSYGPNDLDHLYIWYIEVEG